MASCLESILVYSGTGCKACFLKEAGPPFSSAVGRVVLWVNQDSGCSGIWTVIDLTGEWCSRHLWNLCSYSMAWRVSFYMRMEVGWGTGAGEALLFLKACELSPSPEAQGSTKVATDTTKCGCLEEVSRNGVCQLGSQYKWLVQRPGTDGLFVEWREWRRWLIQCWVRLGAPSSLECVQYLLYQSALRLRYGRHERRDLRSQLLEQHLITAFISSASAGSDCKAVFPVCLSVHLCCTYISLELWDPRRYCRIDEFIIEEGALSKVVPCKLCHLPFGEEIFYLVVYPVICFDPLSDKPFLCAPCLAPPSRSGLGQGDRRDEGKARPAPVLEGTGKPAGWFVSTWTLPQVFSVFWYFPVLREKWEFALGLWPRLMGYFVKPLKCYRFIFIPACYSAWEVFGLLERNYQFTCVTPRQFKAD